MMNEDKSRTETAARMLGGASVGSESLAVLVASAAAAGTTGVPVDGGFGAAALGAGASPVVVEFVRLRGCMCGDAAAGEGERRE